MRGPLITAVLAFAAGCHAYPEDTLIPSQVDIARLEARLGKHPCIRDLGLWERSYRFSRKSGLLTPYSLNPDLDVIEFHFRRAGTATIEAGRKILTPGHSGDWPDSESIQSIDGRFQLNSNRLVLSRCEPIMEI